MALIERGEMLPVDLLLQRSWYLSGLNNSALKEAKHHLKKCYKVKNMVEMQSEYLIVSVCYFLSVPSPKIV